MLDIGPFKMLADRGDGDWVNVVVLLVFALASLVWGWVKNAGRNRVPPGRGTSAQLPGRPTTPRPQTWRERLERQLGQLEAPEERPERPARAEEARPSVSPVPNVRAASPKVAEAGPRVPSPTTGIVKKPAAPADRERAGGLAIDLSDPEQLKKAIVVREVLGKPLGLRDPSPAASDDGIT
jgi:hypothetical protein